MRVLVGAASQRRVATSGAKSFFLKNEQLFRGIRGSPEVGDVDFSEFPVGISSFERALFSLASSNWF